MTKEQCAELTSLEGRKVNVALVDGSRLDDCELVSAGRDRLGTLWLFANGSDLFVPLNDVIALWENLPLSGHRIA